ncbi:MAG: phosphatase PAP2 family protein [Ilumatobacteraceae bacterium]
MTPERAPGQGSLGPAVAELDERADALLEVIRSNPIADRVFTTASHLGDWSLIWHLIGVTRGIAKRRPDQVVALAVALGAESLIVNQGIKRLFRRARPTASGDPRFPVRQPSTSAFPSGHASSAAFAATILSTWDGRSARPLWWGIATIVGTSRAYVRIHHASDVLGGAVVGAGLGWLATRVLRRAGIRPAGMPRSGRRLRRT